MSKELIKVPDLGSDDAVDIIEVTVQAGDEVEVESTLIVVESDKATVEIPSPKAGKIVSMKVKEGDSVNTGDPLAEIEVAAVEGESADEAAEQSEQPEQDDQDDQEKQEEQPAAESAQNAEPQTEEVEFKVPELGDVEGAELIEWMVAVGDTVEPEQLVAVLESDKASFEVPIDKAGEVLALTAEIGQSMNTGDSLLTLKAASSQPPAADAQEEPEPTPAESSSDEPAATEAQQTGTRSTPSKAPASSSTAQLASAGSAAIYAGPATRRLAREMGVDLSQVSGTGVKDRVTKEDVKAFVKNQLSGGGAVGSAQLPEIDFSQFGEITQEAESRLRQVAAQNLHRSWITIPSVTHQQAADVTDLEAFRQQENKRNPEQKLTLMAFLLKACAAALQQFPRFNASLSNSGKELIYKHYVHIGMAVDTEHGLMVPVIRDVDKKGLHELAAEVVELAEKARDRKLQASDMQGGCFTISSLGGIGGGYFSPIINWPEVAILGVGRSEKEPRWNGEEFVPRDMLPLSLTYDHRVVDGADAARFSRYLAGALEDLRRVLL